MKRYAHDWRLRFSFNDDDFLLYVKMKKKLNYFTPLGINFALKIMTYQDRDVQNKVT